MKLDLDHLIATLSCHTAVRAGDVLSNDEMAQVIQRWLQCRLPWTCPHGRPTMLHLSVDELARMVADSGSRAVVAMPICSAA